MEAALKIRKLKNNLQRAGIVPQYVEVALFLGSLVFILLLVSDRSFEKEVAKFFLGKLNIGALVLALLMVNGAYMSLRRVFSVGEMPSTEKLYTLIYVVSLDVCVGLAAASYILQEKKTLLMIFPVLNLLSAGLLVLLAREKINDAESVSDDSAKITDIIVDVIAVFAIVVVSQYWLKDYWLVTYSAALVYAGGLNDIVNRRLKEIIG